MNFLKRIYEDYFKKNRLSQYKKLLIYAKSKGYKMVGIYDFYSLISKGFFPDSHNKIIISRHDIDTSPRVARMMFEIEKSVYGDDGTSTFYFRDSTVDVTLIHDIENCSYETGYHYEEIATFEKKNKLKNKDSLIECFDVFRKMFLKDLSNFRKKTGSKSLTVASHGDFINTKYQLQNYEFLNDTNTRAEAGIAVEAYDECVNRYIKERFADHKLLELFESKVNEAIEKSCDCILILTHPRNWKVDFFANTKDNFSRLIQGLKYWL